MKKEGIVSMGIFASCKCSKMLQNPVQSNLQDKSLKNNKWQGCSIPTRKIVQGMILHMNMLRDWDRKSI